MDYEDINQIFVKQDFQKSLNHLCTFINNLSISGHIKFNLDWTKFDVET